MRARSSIGETTSDELAAGGGAEIVMSTANGTRRARLSDGQRVVIGRAPDCDIVVDDGSVSRRHAVLEAGDPPRIEDLRSRNGTKVQGGRRIAPNRPIPLPFGCVAELGSALLVVLRGRAAFPTKHSSGRSSSTATVDHVVADPVMLQLHALLDVVAPSELSVLILGETGTGKEVCAQAIHARSLRSDRPFVAVNCAALTESLLESELFGHEKGAFTGAVAARKGLFETADGGTIFLDEIGEMPIGTQAKLLRVLQRGEVLRVGSSHPRRVDFRVISATNREVEEAIAKGAFRADLYYRINGFVATIPPLRSRPGDILPLARHFLRGALRRRSARGVTFTPAAEQALLAHTWPGNVRELRTAVERAVVLAAGRATIDTADFGLAAPPRRASSPPALAETHEAPHERERIMEALDRTHGNQKLAAKLLGVSRQTLASRLRRYRIGRPRKGFT